jgi:hypothetical protein
LIFTLCNRWVPCCQNVTEARIHQRSEEINSSSASVAPERGHSNGRTEPAARANLYRLIFRGHFFKRQYLIEHLIEQLIEHLHDSCQTVQVNTLEEQEGATAALLLVQSRAGKMLYVVYDNLHQANAGIQERQKHPLFEEPQHTTTNTVRNTTTNTATNTATTNTIRATGCGG